MAVEVVYQLHHHDSSKLLLSEVCITINVQNMVQAYFSQFHLV